MLLDGYKVLWNNSFTELQFYFSKVLDTVVIGIAINMFNGVVDRIFSVVKEPANALNSCSLATTSNFDSTAAFFCVT